MKVLFIRHGESVDDVENRYGGWADFPLTPRGKNQIKNIVKPVRALGEDFEFVFTSPLTRAKGSAEILAKGLKIPFEVLEYVKERNTYGLLSGMKKEKAKEKYPDQVTNLDEGKYVDGSERQEDLIIRAKKSIQMIEKSGYQSLIVVTHGNYLKCLVEDLIKKKLIKKEDGGFALMELKKGSLKIISSNGIKVD